MLAINATGVFNVSGDNRLSKFEFGMQIAKIAGLDTSRIKASRLFDRRDLIQRPFDMSLSNGKVSKLLKRSIGGLDQCLEQLLVQENLDNIKEIRSL